MKKFYKTVDVCNEDSKYIIHLDGKSIKTPLKKNLSLESKALVEAIAEEWSSQEDIIEPEIMPLTQLANTLIDKTSGKDRAAMNEQVLNYASSDLVCYFASHPEQLVELHEQKWRPLVDWLKKKYGVELNTVSGIQYIEQSEETLNLIKDILEDMPADEFTALQAATAVTGSFVISLAMLKGEISVADAYQAAYVDEIYQLDTWGADEEAQGLLDKVKNELASIIKFKELIKASY